MRIVSCCAELIGSRIQLIAALCCLMACGGAPARIPSSPTSLSTNHAPQIVSATVSPSVGVRHLTTFRAHVNANDPDGDPLSYAWSSQARGVVGTEADLSFKDGEIEAPLTVTVMDRHGATASALVDFVAGELNHSYDGYYGDGPGFDFAMRLSQAGTVVTGTFRGYGRENPQWFVHPSEPGQIDAEGRLRIRFTLGRSGDSSRDFTLTGRLVRYDRPFVGQFFAKYVATGHVAGGEFDGRSFTFGQHNPY